MKIVEKEKSRELRKQGLSIKKIAKTVGVAKSSVSLWVRDIKLTKEQIEELNKAQAVNYTYILKQCAENHEKAKARHKQFFENGYNRAKVDEKFRLTCALYWGEGSKASKGVVCIANCDPAMLNLFFNWLVEEGFEDKITFVVQYYLNNGISESDIKKYWLDKINGLSEKHFRKFTICKINRASQKKKIGKQLYGTGSVVVCNTELHFNILGGIEFLRNSHSSIG